MQIVIDIPEEEYEFIRDHEKENPFGWKSTKEIVRNAILNGIPLPKGHGELIDRNDLKYEKYNSYAYAIANAPTIIEADKAERSRNDMPTIPLHNTIELPKDEVVYGYISKQFPTTNVFFDFYETALNSAKHDQPAHRPFYLIKATRHFEFCGIVESVAESEDKE